MLTEVKTEQSHLGDTRPRTDGAGRRLDSRDLFGDDHVVLIHHEGGTYTLRRTRNGKLLLTK